MSDSVHLIVHNVGALVSGLTAVALAIFCIVNNRTKLVNRTLALTNVAVAIFSFSHLIGTNVPDPHLSRLVLMFNLSVIFTIVFTVHTAFAFLEMDRSRTKTIFFIYTIGIGMTIFYIIFPETFILDSVPKMYFPNYYVPGQLHWLMRIIFQILFTTYLFVELVIAAIKNPNPVLRNRAKYFAATAVLGYGLGLIPLFLIYNIPLDPVWGIWFVPIYSIPLVYAIVTYDLVDVKIIARKAFLYGLALAVVCGFLVAFNFSNEWIRQAYPLFPIWIIPLITSIGAVSVAFFVWRSLRQGELLKYEFITVVTHKFRTPLTHIKWAAENLTKSPLSPEDQEQLNFIRDSNSKLVELTNLLMNVSETENSTYQYKIEPQDLSTLTDDVITSLASQTQSRHIIIEKNYTATTKALCDPSRIRFVVQVLLENALHYAPEKSTVTIAVFSTENEASISVTDRGIGIPKEEVPLLFTKFYRGKQAKLADTEGMGIGLFLSKEVITRQSGKLSVTSPGPNQGSTFTFSLPAVK